MDEKEKLLSMIKEALERYGEDCEICQKMGYECPVVIPEDAGLDFKPDLSVCVFWTKLYKTLTTQ